MSNCTYSFLDRERAALHAPIPANTLDGNIRFWQQDYDWQTQGACAGLPDGLDVFFPEDARGRRNMYNEARRYCESCPVQAECLQAALVEERGMSDRFRFGMRGGKTPLQRSKMAKAS